MRPLETSVEFPKKIKYKTTISSGDFAGYLPKLNENSTLKREVHPCVHCSVVCSSVLLLHVASVGRGCLCRWRSPQSEPYPRRATSVSVGCQACEGEKREDLGEVTKPMRPVLEKLEKRALMGLPLPAPS